MTESVFAPKDFIAQPQRSWTLPEALNYTRRLATAHYENFQVVSFLLPKHLHQDFYNVYSYCRWADDLGDEIGNLEESTRLLNWWRRSLAAMYRGEADHPVFLALRGTVQRHSIPREPFDDLITAFLQDQIVTRYQNWDHLFQYCACSANPVGRLVLYLCGYSDPYRQMLSDFTCTGLQLANFWQDVAIDLTKNRVYLPLDLLARHGVPVNDLFAHRATPAFRAAMREAVAQARDFFREGLPLSRMVDRRLSLDLKLFSQGGLRILTKIEKLDCDVFSQRPTVSKPERVAILIGAMLNMAFAKQAA
ncbi:MAG: squalene synthase HpnC [Acidobacteriota bacterium]|nr:squalene synthase HpnC [Acidobacteriota bacterium]